MKAVKLDSLAGLGSRRGVPRVAAHIDWATLSLDDRDGFVLSRVDGRTSFGEICLLSPFPEEDTLRILRGLHARGVIEVPGIPRPTQPTAPPPAAPSRPTAPISVERVPINRLPAEPAAARAPRSRTPLAVPTVTADLPPIRPEPPSPPPSQPSLGAEAYRFPHRKPEAVAADRAPPPWTLSEPQPAVPSPPSYVFPASTPPGATPPPSTPPSLPVVDESGDAVELAPEVRARVDEMLALAGHVDAASFLGVSPGVDKREIRRAYFRLSKEFHPDRYFKRQLGPYKKRLQLVFNALTEAFETLSGEQKDLF